MIFVKGKKAQTGPEPRLDRIAGYRLQWPGTLFPTACSHGDSRARGLSLFDPVCSKRNFRAISLVQNHADHAEKAGQTRNKLWINRM